MGDAAATLITVSCESHHQKLINGLWTFFVEKQKVDYDLHYCGRTVPAHRLVLDVFLSPDKLSDPSVEQHLHQQSGDGSGLDSLLEFLYKGRVSVTQEQLTSLLEVAKALDFQMLVEAATRAPETSNGADGGSFCTGTTAPSKVPRRKQSKPTKRPRKVGVDGSTRSDSGDSDGSPVSKRVTRRSAGLTHHIETDESSNTTDESTDGDDSDSEESRKSDGSDWEGGEGRSKVEGGDQSDWTTTDMAIKPVKKGGTLPGIDPNRRLKPKKTEMKRPVGRPRKTNTSLLDLLTGSKRGGSARRGRRRPHSQRGELQCVHCPYKTATRRYFDVHQAKHDPNVVVYRCTSCSKAYMNEDGLRRHLATVHPDGPSLHHCPHCDYKTRRAYRFKCHLSKHADSNVVALKCPQCRIIFFKPDSLERHLLKHAAGELLPRNVPLPHRCPHCALLSDDRLAHNQHLFEAHGMGADGEPLTSAKHSCLLCDFVCVHLKLMRAHLAEQHSANGRLQCPDCPFATSVRQNLYRHVEEVHRHVRKFCCETCGHRATTTTTLAIHQRTHSGDKPYACLECERKFADMGTLKRHRRKHAADTAPAFVCDLCGGAFTRRDSLKKHLRRSHKQPSVAK